jgi:hypothetical protein
VRDVQAQVEALHRTVAEMKMAAPVS